jgi:hypothetical protein
MRYGNAVAFVGYAKVGMCKCFFLVVCEVSIGAVLCERTNILCAFSVLCSSWVS